MRIPRSKKYEKAFWAKCQEEEDAKERKPLTDEQMYEVDCQIKQSKIDRANCIPDPRWPGKKRGK